MNYMHPMLTPPHHAKLARQQVKMYRSAVIISLDIQASPKETKTVAIIEDGRLGKCVAALIRKLDIDNAALFHRQSSKEFAQLRRLVASRLLKALIRR